MKFFVGLVGMSVIIFLIAGPLLLFSTFNPISEPNPVLNSMVDLNILIKQVGSDAINKFNLFSNNYVTELSYLSEDQYQAM